MGVKQVIVVRKDLRMRAGKMAAQVAHGAMAFLGKSFAAARQHATLMDFVAEVPMDITALQWEWLDGNYRKIVAYVESHKELLQLIEKAHDAGVASYPIIDEGLTEFKEPTMTCVAFGPDTDERLDAITGGLKLL